MAFSLYAGVKPIGRYDPTSQLTFIKYYGKKSTSMHYKVGGYGFSNPVSASMFAYLFRQPDVGPELAKKCVVRFEQMIDPTGAAAAMHETSAMDVVSKIPRIGQVIEAGAKAMDAAGNAFVNMTIDFSKGTARYNPYAPVDSTTWTGKGYYQYVDYAVAYYKKYPRQGPAYQLQRELA